MQTITAIYEHGVLRPLTPLQLPEQSQVEVVIRIITPDIIQARRAHIRQVLVSAGLMSQIESESESTPLSTADRSALAQRLEMKGIPPLSDAILEERETNL